MAWFGKPSGPAASWLTSAWLAELETFGRKTFDPNANALEDDIELRMWNIYQADKEAYMTAMGAAAVEHGGWTAYGIERMYVSICSDEGRAHPAYDQVMSSALSFLRSRGVPNMHLSGYEMRWWADHDGQSESWLVGKPAPDPGEAPIVELDIGEERTLAQMTADPTGNIILLLAGQPGGLRYDAVIDGPWNETDPTRHRNVWYSADTLPALYKRVGEALQVPPYWTNPELKPYIPLNNPEI